MTSLGEDFSLQLKVGWDPLSREVIYDQLDFRLGGMGSPSKIKIPYFLAIFKISNFRSLVAEQPEGLHPTGLQLIIRIYL
jgi:hypothetical protein